MPISDWRLAIAFDGIYAGSKGRIIEVACGTHARRSFHEVQRSAGASALKAPARIGQLDALPAIMHVPGLGLLAEKGPGLLNGCSHSKEILPRIAGLQHCTELRICAEFRKGHTT